MKEDIYEEAAERAWGAILDKVRKLSDAGETIENISERLHHKSKSGVSTWLNGKATAKGAKFSDMLRYMQALGLNPLDYIPGVRVEEGDIDLSHVNEFHSKDGQLMRRIPIFSIAGAGPGIDVTEHEPISTIFIPEAFDGNADMAVLVNGHSMEPTVPDGGIAGIKWKFDFNANGIYCVYLRDEGNMIKRIGIDLNKKVFVIKSDNADKEEYPDIEVSMLSDDLKILGRVVWVFGRH